MDLYHVLNRGVDKRTIFHDNQDRARFVHDMYEFNSTAPARSNLRRRAPSSFPPDSSDKMVDVGRRPFYDKRREPLVDIHGWVLMGNHYHLLLSECTEQGIPLFLKRLNGGYAKYYNEKYSRVGTLFQGRTKKVLIDNDPYFLHILNYIHFNPLDMLGDTALWRERKITHAKAALEYLAQYRWSSYPDYIGIKNFPSILTRDLFDDVFRDYKKEVRSYLTDIDTEQLGALMLE